MARGRPPISDRGNVRNTITLRLPAKLIERLDGTAARLRKPRTDLIETAVQTLLDAVDQAGAAHG